jgi:hypothetical protein
VISDGVRLDVALEAEVSDLLRLEAVVEAAERESVHENLEGKKYINYAQRNCALTLVA